MVQQRYLRLSRLLAIFLVLAMSIVTPAGIADADSLRDSFKPLEESDTVPPAFKVDSPSPWPQSEGSRMVGVTILTEEAAYYHLVLLPKGAAPPNKDQVMAGTDCEGKPALQAKKSNSKNTRFDVIMYVDEHSIDYDIYIVLRDDAGNLSEPAKVDVRSPDGAQLIKGDGIRWVKGDDGSRQVWVEVSLQNIEAGYKGKVYWVLLPMDAEEPSISQIAEGTDGDGKLAISAGSPELDPLEDDGQFVVTGAAGDTKYNLYLVVGDTKDGYPLGRCTIVQHMEVTTPPDVADEKVCEMNGIQYETLTEALDKAGSTATIKLLKSITSLEGVLIENKNITFDLDGYDLTIDTTDDVGLKVVEGTVALVGEGEFNVSGKFYGVSASSGSTVTVTNATSWDNMSDERYSSNAGVMALTGSKIKVRGNATGHIHGIRAENVNTEVIVEGDVLNSAQINGAVHCEDQALALVKGNVTATRGYGVRSNGGKITVNKDVYGALTGAKAEGINPEIHIKGDLISSNNGAIVESSNGIIIVDGEIKGSDYKPNLGDYYVSIGSTRLSKERGVPDPERHGYLKYSSAGASGVWVREPHAAAIWEVSNALELKNALDNFQDGDTIRLTDNIDYNKGIIIDGKTVTFDLGNYILNVKSITPSMGSNGLHVKNSGNVNLEGSGQLNISLTGGNTSVGVMVEGGSTATVTNIELLVLNGSAFGAYADGNGSVIHVLGNIDVFGEGGCGARTWGRGRITIDGIIKASVYITIGSTYKDKTSCIDDPEMPGYLKYSTPPNETGIIWVKAEESEPTFSVTVKNGSGGGDYAEDEVVTITADDAPEGQRFKEWSISPSVSFIDNTNKNSQTTKFIMPAQAVIATAIYEVIPTPTPEYTIIVQNDGNGTAVAGVNSAAAGTEITLIATAKSGYKFKEWQVVSGGITITNNKFTMPAADVIIKAVFEAIPQPTFTVTVNNGTGFGSFAPGDIVAIKANEPMDGKVFDKWTSSDAIVFSNAYNATTTFVMPNKDVTVNATYKDDSSDNPKTGDTVYPWGWLLLCSISAIGITLLVVMKKYKKA